MVPSFTKPFSPCFFGGHVKRESALHEYYRFRPHGERITSQCAETDGNADLFHPVHLNFAKRIQLYIENDGNHVENMIYQH